MIWTKHVRLASDGAPLGHDINIKPYYMQRTGKGSMAEHCAIRERVRGARGRRTRWALYYLMNRECELVGLFKTLGDAKATANMRYVNDLAR